MKYVIVYQGGFANVFEVNKALERKRLLQGSFEACEFFMRGLQHAGSDCYFACCNMAGDIADGPWITRLDCAPFSDRFGMAWLPAWSVRGLAVYK